MSDDGTANVYIGTTPVPARDNSEPVNYWVNGIVRPSSIIRKRIGSGTLQDLFVSVIEPMNNGVSVIQNVERLPMNGAGLESCAVRITFTDGRVDTCVVNLRNPQVAGANTGAATVSTTNGQFSLTGRIGVYSTGPAGARAWAVNASQFIYPGGSFAPTNLYYSGQIIAETRNLDGANYNAFVTTTPLPLGTALQGEQLSLTFGALSGSGTSGISEMFQIDQVIFTNRVTAGRPLVLQRAHGRRPDLQPGADPRRNSKRHEPACAFANYSQPGATRHQPGFDLDRRLRALPRANQDQPAGCYLAKPRRAD
jgi:hypothetical protein